MDGNDMIWSYSGFILEMRWTFRPPFCETPISLLVSWFRFSTCRWQLKPVTKQGNLPHMFHPITVCHRVIHGPCADPCWMFFSGRHTITAMWAWTSVVSLGRFKGIRFQVSLFVGRSWNFSKLEQKCKHEKQQILQKSLACHRKSWEQITGKSWENHVYSPLLTT